MTNYTEIRQILHNVPVRIFNTATSQMKLNDKPIVNF